MSLLVLGGCAQASPSTSASPDGGASATAAPSPQSTCGNCGPDTPSPQRASSAPASGTPSSTPANPATRPLVVDELGYGPAVVGASLAAAERAGAVAWDANGCGPGAGGWYFRSSNGARLSGAAVATKGKQRYGVVTQMMLWDTAFATADGIHPGLSAAAFKAKWKGQPAQATENSELYVRTSATGSSLGAEVVTADDPQFGGKLAWFLVTAKGVKVQPMYATEGISSCAGE